MGFRNLPCVGNLAKLCMLGIYACYLREMMMWFGGCMAAAASYPPASEGNDKPWQGNGWKRNPKPGERWRHTAQRTRVAGVAFPHRYWK